MAHVRGAESMTKRSSLIAALVVTFVPVLCAVSALFTDAEVNAARQFVGEMFR
jgi:hypothetical protein